MEKGESPKAKFNVGQIQVAVWENQSGEGRSRHSIRLTKRYKDGNEWKSTNSLGINDLPKAMLALNKAYEFVLLKEQAQN